MSLALASSLPWLVPHIVIRNSVSQPVHEPARERSIPTETPRFKEGPVDLQLPAVEIVNPLAAGLLTFVPLSTFFAVNAASYVVSAALVSRIHPATAQVRPEETTWEQIRTGLRALRLLPVLAVAVAVLGIAVTIESGTWMVGVPELVRTELGVGAGAFSLVMTSYAVGSITAGLFLARRPIGRKALGSLLSWCLYLPAYLLMGLAASVPLACMGAISAGVGQGGAIVLLNSAAQADVPDRVLGRVMGLISLVHRGGHATGLLFVAPLFAFVEPRPVFFGAALAGPLVGIGGAALAGVLTHPTDAAPEHARSRTRRS